MTSATSPLTQTTTPPSPSPPQFGHLDILVNNAGIISLRDGPTKGQMNAAAVVSHCVRTMFIRSSILRAMENRLELRLCSILSPVKKVRTNSARESAFIFWRSTSIFLTISRFSLLLLRVMMPACGKRPDQLMLSNLTAAQLIAFLQYLEEERGNSRPGKTGG